MAAINEQKTRITKNDIVSAEAIRAYLENKLSDGERTTFELLVAKDAFDADALEGFRGEGNINDTFAAVESISNQLCERCGISKKPTNTLAAGIKFDQKLFSYAAVGIIIAIGVIVLFRFSKVSQQPVFAITEETVSPDSSVAIKELSKDTAIATSIPQTTTLAEKMPDTVTTAPISVSLPSTRDSSTKEIATDAMTLFNNGNYIDAEKKFDEIFKDSPNNYEAQFFSAVSAYFNGNNDKAEKQFDNMLNSGIYVDGSKWYKANILLKKGETAVATEILRSLSVSSGIYKERAVKKLEIMNR